MENIQAVGVIIGLVNGVRLLKEGVINNEYWSFYLFISSLLFGIILGALGYFNLTIESGIIIALASSGLYRVSEKVSGK
jgi:hypothetical protein